MTLIKLALVVFFVALGGCSNVYISEVQRTVERKFDGTWLGAMIDPGGLQVSEQTTFDCPALNTSLEVVVQNGRIAGSFDDKLTFETYLDNKGGFYIDIPKESTYLVEGRSRFGAHEFHVFRGVLDFSSDNGSGYYRDALGQMGSGGCRYEIEFKRIDS